jgi:hypothetical protein
MGSAFSKFKSLQMTIQKYHLSYLPINNSPLKNLWAVIAAYGGKKDFSDV